jgi:PAS domain S-box-containing protein
MKPTGKLQVLTIEDSVEDSELIQLELKRAGFDLSIHRVETENEMRSSLEKKKWDLITSDFQMPHFSALEALRIWKETEQEVPFFIISGVINNEEAIELMKAGATEYILKNHLSRLGPAVERELKEAESHKEKKRISKELAASQQLYRIITENMTDTVWIMDIKTQKITYLNPAANKSFGYSIKELEKLTINHILAPESVNLLRLQMKNAAIDGEHDWESEHLRTFQLEYIRKNKTRFWSEDILDTIRDGNNQITHILGVGRDITLRKKQEEEVIRSRDYIWTLFENFPALIWRTGLDGKCNYLNLSWLKWTGRTLEQELGEGWMDGIFLDDYEAALKTVDSAKKKREPFQIEYRLRHASGEYRWIMDIGRPFNDLDGNFAGYLGSCYDIHEERQNRDTIVKRAEKMGKLYEITRDFNKHQNLQTILDLVCEKTMQLMEVPEVGVSTYDPQMNALIVKSIRGYDIPIGTVIPSGVGIAGKVIQTHLPIVLNEYASYEARLAQFYDAPFAATMTIPMLFGDDLIGILGLGEFKPSKRIFTEEDLKWASLLANAAAGAIYNAELYQSVQTKADQLAMLYDAGLALNSMLEPKKLLSFLLQIAQQTLSCERIAFLRVNEDNGTVVYEVGHGLPQKLVEKLSRIEIQAKKDDPIDRLMQSHLPVKYSNMDVDLDSEIIDPSQKSYLLVPVNHDGKIIGIIAGSDKSEDKFSPADERLMVLFGNQTAVAIINSRMFAEIKNRSKELEALASISAAMRPAQTSSEIITIILTNLLKLAHAKSAEYLKFLPESHEYIIENAIGQVIPEIGSKVSKELIYQLKVNMQKPFFLHPKEIENFKTQMNWIKENTEAVFIPLLIDQEVAGYLYFSSDKTFDENIINILLAVADKAANAINRATLHEETEKRMEHLSALRTIDNAITSSTDLTFVLNVLIEQVKEKLRVDAVSILLYDPITNYLEHAASIGFLHKAVYKTRLRFGESYAGRAASDKKTFRVTELENDPAKIISTSPFIKDEGFVEFIGNPLIVKGKLVGVLEIFQRSSLEVDDEWLSFLSGIAQQAAIAIDNAQLFQELEKLNINLMAAYDSTLEGWSNALELRDRETQGHSKRVVDMTIEIALQMGINSDKLVHIRRGALLHDIGKVGIPDSILLKPGTLSSDERLAMEQHPVLAYNLLSSIDYLQPALDIPYSHHEKWDGTGYPNGLIGQKIPLQARIFSVVDVYDALTSDRPYRKAWLEKDALDYIAEQSGKYFDPEVVEIFQKLIVSKDINKYSGNDQPDLFK